MTLSPCRTLQNVIHTQKCVLCREYAKPSLNPDDSANYRPISNLSFVSKLLERAVHAQLLMYLYENELLPSV